MKVKIISNNFKFEALHQLIIKILNDRYNIEHKEYDINSLVHRIYHSASPIIEDGLLNIWRYDLPYLQQFAIVINASYINLNCKYVLIELTFNSHNKNNGGEELCIENVQKVYKRFMKNRYLNPRHYYYFSNLDTLNLHMKNVDNILIMGVET